MVSAFNLPDLDTFDQASLKASSLLGPIVVVLSKVQRARVALMLGLIVVHTTRLRWLFIYLSITTMMSEENTILKPLHRRRLKFMFLYCA